MVCIPDCLFYVMEVLCGFRGHTEVLQAGLPADFGTCQFGKISSISSVIPSMPVNKAFEQRPRTINLPLSDSESGDGCSPYVCCNDEALLWSDSS
jgi:hypothetical protein